jgi:hypothetical protein
MYAVWRWVEQKACGLVGTTIPGVSQDKSSPHTTMCIIAGAGERTYNNVLVFDIAWLFNIDP